MGQGQEGNGVCGAHPRANLAAAGNFFSEIPRFAFAEADEDRTGLQSACDQLKARLFLSTGYTTPISTPSIAFIYDLEAEAGSQFHPEYIEKKNAILAAAHYVFFSDEVLAGFRTHYPGIPPEQMSLVYPAIEGWAKPAAPDAMAEFRRKFQLTRPFSWPSCPNSWLTTVASRLSAKLGRSCRAKSSPAPSWSLPFPVLWRWIPSKRNCPKNKAFATSA